MTGYESKKDMAQDKLDSMEREALKLELDWAETHGEAVFSVGGTSAVTSMNAWAAAIKEALAQPEQEPVAFSCLRCVTPKKCAVHGCSPNTWPSEYSPKRRDEP